MKAIKTTLILALVLYLCASLSGTLFVLTVSAQITAKEVDEPTKFYQIRDGDTLGGLAKQYRSDSRLWQDFEKYNIFANPNLIYPNEQLQVPTSWSLPGDPRMESERKEQAPVAREAIGFALEAPSLIIEDSVSTGDFEAFKDAFNSYRGDLDTTITDLGIQLQQLQNATESNARAIPDLRESSKVYVVDHHLSNERKIDSLRKQVTDLQRAIPDLREFLKVYVVDHHISNERKIDTLNNSVEALKGTEDKMLEELEALRQPPSAAPSKRTRTFAVLTALSAGAAWLALNVVGGRD